MDKTSNAVESPLPGTQAQSIQVLVLVSALLHGRSVGDVQKAKRAELELRELGVRVRFARSGDDALRKGAR